LGVVVVGIAFTASLPDVQELDVPAASAEELLQMEAGAGGVDVDVDGAGEAPKKKLGYDSIVGFVFKHMGQELMVKNRNECEETCDGNESCRSYSYNPIEKLCVWSIETIQYRIGFAFYTKVKSVDAFGKLKPNGKWRNFPDIMYQEPGYAKLNGHTVKQCQRECEKDKRCSAFSYDIKKERCFLTDSGIHYDPNFVYYEKRGAIPKKNALDEADKQEAIQADEKAAKKARRIRLTASMQKMEDENNAAMNEMKLKSNRRELSSKKEEKLLAEKKLAREKSLEARDKRLAKMKAVYNEGYFKAKGVAAEKKSKEKDIKKLREKEYDDKLKRKATMENQNKRKKNDQKEKEQKRDKAQGDLIDAKEKITKIKNKEVELEIEKEDKVLDVAKNLALAKFGALGNAKRRERDQKYDAMKKEHRQTKEFGQKTDTRKMQLKVNKKELAYLQRMSEEKRYDDHKVNVTETN